jgi:hypothetical protein
MTVTVGQLACTQRKLRYHSTDVQTDIHIVPVDCDLKDHNLLILPTPCLVMVHGLGIYSLSGAPISVTNHV